MHIDDMRLPFRLKIIATKFKGGIGQFEQHLDNDLDLQVIRVKQTSIGLEADLYIYDKDDSDKLMSWFWKNEPATYEKSPADDFYTMESLKNNDTDSILHNCNPNYQAKRK